MRSASTMSSASSDSTDGNIKFVKLMRKLGLCVIYDLDDNLWNLQPSNYATPKLQKYVDGLIHIEDGEVIRYGIKECMCLADAIVVSTEHLKRTVTNQLGILKNEMTGKPIPIVVVENYIDPVLFRPNTDENEEVVIGWGGSNTHQGDVGEVWDLLPGILEKYDNVRMEFVGMPPPTQIARHPRVTVRGWVHIAEYAQTLSYWNWDIFLAPLETNKFNKSKSNIKMQEAGALGKPCLASYVDNYVTFAKLANEKSIQPGNILWSLCATKSQWQNRLEYLIENKQARLDLGAKFRANVLTHFDIANQSWRWQHVCDMVFD